MSPPDRPQTPGAPRVSVVIPALRNPDLRACVESVLRSRTSEPFDLMVVLNGATDEVVRIARDLGDRVRLIESPVNLGVSGGFNLGFSHAQEDYLVQLQDDVIVEAGWLDPLVAAADAYPGAGAVASLTLDEEGAVMDPGWMVWGDGSTSPDLIDASRRADDYTDVRPIDYHGSAGMLIRRAAWQSVGGFDPAYFPAYYGDVDFCLRLHDRGWGVLLEPRSRVAHRGHASTTTWFQRFLTSRNRERFLLAHGSAIATRPAYRDDPSSTRWARVDSSTPIPGGPPPSATPRELSILDERIKRHGDHAARLAAAVEIEYRADLETKMARLEAHLAQTQDRLDRAHADLESLSRIHAADHAALQAAHREIRSKSDALRSVEGWAAELELALTALQGTRSWRITAPFRRTATRVRNGVRRPT